MSGLRDHDPFVIDSFNGYWDRGDDESCPSDHFITAENVQYFESGVSSRFPVDIYQFGNPTPIRNVVRLYNYVMQNGRSLLVLNSSGQIYHIIGQAVYGPILSIPAMEDFGFISFNGNAYITPFHSLQDANGQNYELGLKDEFVYVYHGDGNLARKAGGKAPSNATTNDPKGGKPFIVFNDLNDGAVTKGIHMLLVEFTNASDPGLYAPGIVAMVQAPGNLKLQVTNIPDGPPGTTARTILMTHAIDPKDILTASTSPYFVATVITDPAVKDIKIDIKDVDLTVGGSYTHAMQMNAMTVANSLRVGYCDLGFHIVGVVYETASGYLTAPGPEYFAANTYINTRQSIGVAGIPVTVDPTVIRRHLVSTKAINDYSGDQRGYQFFFIPGGTINDPLTTNYTQVDYYDSDLVDDASHLMDNYEAIPAGVGFGTYHSRLVIVGIASVPEELIINPHTHVSPDNRSVALLSAHGEPEAISKVDGLIIAPLDGAPLTAAQEFRDILYLFKNTRTYGYSDNGEEPASWSEQVVDQGIGAPVHGVAAVLDSGGVNTDFLLIVDWSGLVIFNGTYARPEMSWKIEDFWQQLSRNGFRQIQITNDSLARRVYITLPDPLRNFMLYADYANGMDAKNIRWAKWVFDANISSVCMINTNLLVLGAL